MVLHGRAGGLSNGLATCKEARTSPLLELVARARSLRIEPAVSNLGRHEVVGYGNAGVERVDGHWLLEEAHNDLQARPVHDMHDWCMTMGHPIHTPHLDVPTPTEVLPHHPQRSQVTLGRLPILAQSTAAVELKTRAGGVPAVTGQPWHPEERTSARDHRWTQHAAMIP